MRIWIALLFILGPLEAHARSETPAVKRTPAMGQAMTIEVVFGNRRSIFKLEGPGKSVTYSTSYGSGDKKAKLTVEDYAFFDRRIRGLTEEDNNPKICPKKYVRIRSRYGVKTGCYGAPNNLAVKMDKIVNLAGKYF